MNLLTNGARSFTNRARLSLKRVALSALPALPVLATAGYGYYWWTVNRLSRALMTPMSAATSRRIAPHSGSSPKFRWRTISFVAPGNAGAVG